MRWSLRIARVAGIGIFVHWTFVFLLAYVGWVYYRGNEGDWFLVAKGILLVLALFGCVILHELGHALMARRYGIPTRDITLLPIGGVARLERMPDDPMQEFWVAVAGPAVNVVIVMLLFGVIAAMGDAPKLMDVDYVSQSFPAMLMFYNGFMVAFNLLPAFPMDGGRVLRAILAMFMPRVQATHIAAAFGQGMAILFGLAGLFIPGAFLLLFIALFVYLGAQAEAQAVEMRAIFQGVPVHEAMATQFRTLSPHDTLKRAVDELLAGHQKDFPVIEGERLVGILFRRDLLESYSQDQSSEVASVMSRDCPTVGVRDRLDQAMNTMQSQQCSTLPVLADGHLVGVLTSENIGEWMMVQSALKDRNARHQRKLTESSQPIG